MTKEIIMEDADNAPPEEAENLRLKGNEAFANKKWKIAVSKYQESIKLDGTSKKSGER